MSQFVEKCESVSGLGPRRVENDNFRPVIEVSGDRTILLRQGTNFDPRDPDSGKFRPWVESELFDIVTLVALNGVNQESGDGFVGTGLE
ncbi:hypothetical protein GCM10025875_31860 [Litorihabitans aurantiacus]|uniref:Uncharacterized protein n=1 Tax=Litorihabitans aurantiacus TaxID=1930061 RepID=A0AA37XHG0_9MICO|nr:hypothetical protein GCM10025875_31860 [Litorihabitans aurantiacus]